MRRCAEALKESFEKAQSSCKQNKREIAGLEEENARINARCRRLQRDLEEVMEAKRTIERDLQNLRKLSRYVCYIFKYIYFNSLLNVTPSINSRRG